jgi:hypothetical protein
VLQLGLLVELSSGQANGRRRAAWKFVLFSALTFASGFLSPIHCFWNFAVGVGAAWGRFRLPDSALARLSGGLFWSGIAVPATLHSGYLWLWYTMIPKPPAAAGGSGTADVFFQRAVAFVDSLVREPGEGLSVAFVLLVPPVLLRVAWRRPRWRAAAVVAAVSFVVTLALAGLLLVRFYVAPRYFFGLSAAACWLTGIACARLFAVARARWGRRKAEMLFAAVGVAFLAACVPFSLRLAATPVHNWAGAVRWMQPRLEPGDIVFCGPNADLEVFWAYSEAIGRPNIAPRWLTVEGGKQLDARSEDGLRAALRFPRRLWFITPFMDAVRPRSYWDVVHRNFTEVARIPGRGDIFILRRDPPE